MVMCCQSDYRVVGFLLFLFVFLYDNVYDNVYDIVTLKFFTLIIKKIK